MHKHSLKSRKKTYESNPALTLLPQSADEALALLAQKRIGGAVNIRGLGFQLLYAIRVLLTKLEPANSSHFVRFEGIEDVDVNQAAGAEYIQIKTSQHPIDANSFWNMQVLQHFMEVFKINPNAKFRLVHNTTLAKGNLSAIGCKTIQQQHIDFWKNKLSEQYHTITISETQNLLSAIEIEKTSEADLLTEIITLLYKQYGVNKQAEWSFIKSLFYHVFEWSKQKKAVHYEEIARLMQLVTDSYSHFPVNPAIQNSWVTLITYEPTPPHNLGYYDGKGARPQDIASGLPIRRPIWEAAIDKSISHFDITVIKSSSGQGKSTLAWQTGLSKLGAGYTVYQINQCKSYDEAVAIADFLDTRLAIGQLPLVIIDGLNVQVAKWFNVAELLSDKPVRMMVTSREEDWIRYGADGSRLRFNIVAIQLSQEEAKFIFVELKKVSRIHATIKTWEPSWELVNKKGLLIEYVYLLTRGEMIETRLSAQVKEINTERDAAAKLEVLRLISVADILNVRLRTNRLNGHIQNHFRLETDRNELYRQLEKEYYLRFDNLFIEGLHPVRSKHLADLLHSSIGIEETLLAILPLLDEDYLYDFFIAAPFQFPNLGADFFTEAAAIMNGHSFTAMVAAADGLMHNEAYSYLRENRETFDLAQTRGGLELLVYDTVPFSKLNTLQSISQMLTSDQGDNIRALSALQEKLPVYSYNNTNIYYFLNGLQKSDEQSIKLEEIRGGAFLFKWFRRLELPFARIVTVNEAQLLSGLATDSITISAERFQFYYTAQPEQYKHFAETNKKEIFGWIKKKTHTPTIYEADGDIHMHYLWDEDIKKVNDSSLQRIDIMKAFFPCYKHYCTLVITLPFPNEDFHSQLVNNSRKKIPPENLHDEFDIHINKIWSRTILDHYSAGSGYEWQKGMTDFRQQVVALIIKCVRLFESKLENNLSKFSKLAGDLDALSNEVISQQNLLKKHSSGSAKYFDLKLFSKEQQVIAEWAASFRNYIVQISYLFNPEHEQFNLPIHNLKGALHKLPKMQEAFDAITDATFAYFDTSKLKSDEAIWFDRLYRTSLYFQAQSSNGFSERVIVASRAIEQWWEEKLYKEIREVHDTITTYEELSPFTFFLPKKIIEDDVLRHVVIGVRGVDFSSDFELTQLLTGLAQLHRTGIHFFTFLSVNNSNEATGGFRVSDTFFQEVALYEQTGEFVNTRPPLPIIPTVVDVQYLEGVSIQQPISDTADDFYFKTMILVWQLKEYRERLHVDNAVEMKWLEELEREYQQQIKAEMKNLYTKEPNRHSLHQTKLEGFLNDDVLISTEEIVSYMLERTAEIQRAKSLA